MSTQYLDLFKNTLDSAKDYSRNNPFSAIGISAGIYFIISQFNKIINTLIKKRKHKKSLQLAAITVNSRNKKIEEFLQKHKNEHDSIQDKNLIITSTAQELIEMLRARILTSRHVTLVFCFRAATYGKDNFWIADADFEQALTQADQCDKLLDSFAETNTSESECNFNYPPLLGLPISIKDNIDVKGLRSTIGLITYRDNIPEEDSYVVKVLREKGAIPFVKTNVPQCMMDIDSSNFLYHSARNAWRSDRSAGGSSGGEGAILAAKCSPLGIGSDIGGSIRIPAGFNGCYGLKPTNNRISRYGLFNFNGRKFSGQNFNCSVVGPMAQNIDDLIFLSQNLFGNYPNDFFVNNKKFNNSEFNNINKKLKIGYFTDLKTLQTANSIKDTISEVVAKLREQGHEVVEFPINNFLDIYDLTIKLMSNSGTMKIIEQKIEAEPACQFFQNSFALGKLSKLKRYIISNLLWFLGQKRISKTISNFRNDFTAMEYCDTGRQFYEARQLFYDYYLNNGFDAIISPVGPTVAFYNNESQHYVPYIHYTAIFNGLDMPSGAIPIKLNDDTGFVARFNDYVEREHERVTKDSMHLPVSILVSTLPYQEEKCLAVMKIVDSLFKYSENEAMRILNRFK